MTAWQSFAIAGDQFLAAYAQLSANTPTSTLFNVGHAAELYLKAVAAWKNPTDDIGRKFGHNVEKLLTAAHDEALVASYQVDIEVRDRIMCAYPHPIEMMEDPDSRTYTANQELYWVAYYLADVKYLGTGLRAAPNEFGVMVMGRNPYWVDFFLELRRFLGWSNDPLVKATFSSIFVSGSISDDALQYLATLDPGQSSTAS